MKSARSFQLFRPNRRGYSIVHRSGLLTDSYPMTWDLSKSHDSFLVHAETGDKYLDMNSGFGSLPLSWNHPGLTARLTTELHENPSYFVNKPSNSDFYTEPYFRFIDTFKRKVVPKEYKYQFFGGDGAWAVTQMIKVATDWKLRKNPDLRSTKVIYFENAFHGRDGFTLSMTNTDPVKTMNFPKFNEWIKIEDVPVIDYQDNLMRKENICFNQIESKMRTNDDIAALVIEPIQCEGGDRYFTTRFLQGLQKLCERYDVMFCVDEVQTGFFSTGTPWYFQKHELHPDIVSFSKKTQQGGIFASGTKLDTVDNHCFVMSSRINSTWGGNLVDMIRCKHVIDIIKEERLQENALMMGELWKNETSRLYHRQHDLISNVRNAGLIMAFDVPDSQTRDLFLDKLMKDHRVLALGCGDRTVRFRPNLSVNATEIMQLVEACAETINEL